MDTQTVDYTGTRHHQGHYLIATMTSKRSRSWCFTLNNYTQADHETLMNWASEMVGNKSLHYCVLGREVGESGTPHIQGFFMWKDAKAFNPTRNAVPCGERMHLEAAIARADQAADYCKKDGAFDEFGTSPVAPSGKGKLTAELRWALLKAGAFEELPPENYQRYKAIALDIRSKEMVDLDNLDNLWIYGTSGCGKSRYVRDNYPRDELYDKLLNKWWDGYQHEPTVLLDDVDPDVCKFLGHHIKRWADRYVFRAEVKGGAMQIRPTRLVVTSQFLPYQCAPNAEWLEAITRRFNVVTIVDGQLLPYTPEQWANEFNRPPIAISALHPDEATLHDAQIR